MLKTICSKKGFTLIELSVVMIIMALVMTVAIQNLSKFNARRNLHTAALRLQQEIRTLGQEALIRESGSYRINFYITKEYYKIFGPEGTKQVTMPPGVDIVETNFDNPGQNIWDQIYFTARGNPTKGGHVTLQSTVTGELKYVIAAAITGRTRISDSPPGSLNDP